MVRFDRYGEAATPLPTTRRSQRPQAQAALVPPRVTPWVTLDQFGDFRQDMPVHRAAGQNPPVATPESSWGLLGAIILIFFFLAGASEDKKPQPETLSPPVPAPYSVSEKLGQRSGQEEAPRYGGQLLNPRVESLSVPAQNSVVLVTCVADQVHLRAGASLDARVVGIAERGNTFAIEDFHRNGWCRLTHQGQPAYIFGAFLSLPPTSPWRVGVCKVQEGWLYLRSGPMRESPTISQALPGENLLLTGLQNGFYRVLLSDGRVGWCADRYVKLRP